MGEIVRFSPRPRDVAPAATRSDRPDEDGWIDRDDALLEDAYAAAYLAAERYERERRRDRDLQARIDALMQENARLREELGRRA